jgi:hypothetical protein
MKKVLVFAVAVLVLVPVARAEAPRQIRTEWNSTRVIAAGADTCAFPIQVHSEGLIHDFV